MKLNIGCGNKRVEGFVGVDKYPCAAVDVLADATQKLPFEDDSVEEVLMDNFIEHVLDVPALMAEILRVCRAGATVTVITPHFTSIDSWRDPTHVHHFSYFSMDHFQKEGVSHYVGKGYKIIEKKLSFGGNLLGLIGRLLFKLSPDYYERRYCFMFRAGTLRFKLAVEK